METEKQEPVKERGEELAERRERELAKEKEQKQKDIWERRLDLGDDTDLKDPRGRKKEDVTRVGSQ